MKKLITLAVILLLVSCKSETKKDATVKVETEKTSKIENSKKNATIELKSNGTYLCKINGKDWHYTKASGIVSRHKKNKKRTAIITFTKQLEKGKESVQLFYDGDTNELEEVTAILKLPKKGGGKMSAMYRLQINGKKRLPESKIAGTIDLSNPTAATGKAEVTKMKIRFEADKLEDETMKVISFTPIDFSGIGYSDSEKLFGSK